MGSFNIPKLLNNFTRVTKRASSNTTVIEAMWRGLTTNATAQTSCRSLRATVRKKLSDAASPNAVVSVDVAEELESTSAVLDDGDSGRCGSSGAVSRSSDLSVCVPRTLLSKERAHKPSRHLNDFLRWGKLHK